MQTMTCKLTIYKSPYFRKFEDDYINQIELNRYYDSLVKVIELGLIYQIVEVDEALYNVCDHDGNILIIGWSQTTINQYFQ